MQLCWTKLTPTWMYYNQQTGNYKKLGRENANTTEGWKYSLFTMSYWSEIIYFSWAHVFWSVFLIEHFWKYIRMTDRTWTDCTSISNRLVFVRDRFSIASTVTKAYCFTYFKLILSCGFRSSAFECQEKSIWYRQTFDSYFDWYTVSLLVAVAPMYPFSLLPEALMYQRFC